MRMTAKARLQSRLSTVDLQTAVCRICDADADTHSSGGSWIELASADGARSFALHWSYSKQGFTAGHTQEAEVAAMYDTLRSDGLPLAGLLEFLLERDIVVEVLEDNEAAIVAARKGYGPRLRHLHRTNRIHVGYLGEIFNEDNPPASLGESRLGGPRGRHTHKGDGQETVREVQRDASTRPNDLLSAIPNVSHSGLHRWYPGACAGGAGKACVGDARES